MDRTSRDRATRAAAQLTGARGWRRARRHIGNLIRPVPERPRPAQAYPAGEATGMGHPIPPPTVPMPADAGTDWSALLPNAQQLHRTRTADGRLSAADSPMCSNPAHGGVHPLERS